MDITTPPAVLVAPLQHDRAPRSPGCGSCLRQPPGQPTLEPYHTHPVTYIIISQPTSNLDNPNGTGKRWKTSENMEKSEYIGYIWLWPFLMPQD